MVALPTGITNLDGRPRLDGVTMHGLGTRKNDQLFEAVVDDLAEFVDPR